MPQAVLDQIAICNQGLFHAAAGKQIASLDEKSAEARACSLFYDTAKDQVLEAFAWPFATLTASLELVQQQPTPEWGYSYRLPVDCMAPRRILSSSVNASPFPNIFDGFNSPAPYPMMLGRIMTAQNRIPYRVMADAAGALLYTDCPPVAATAATTTALASPQLPQLEYTAEQDAPQFYRAQFCIALSWLIGAYVAPGLTGGDKFKREQICWQMFVNAIQSAQANAGNSEQPDQPAESEAVRARW
jgi:hypothetical protein